ncbi:hypothetical protein [Borrelia turicatae]|uniref:hypothetical protein n=1 Tax=Borrelia turicatae TaxID=142 RepID=UPI0003516810|nr:hypothetical protein [Borrelia turicatae]UPA13960.1 hypothetical protein bt91E135_001122 [Borrelia turicatae 91E135]UPA15453.1 hypothetical protein btBTE5EL_001133 [Borrelia turicatae]
MKRINILLFMLCILSILVCKQGVTNKSNKKIDAAQREVIQPGSNSKLVAPVQKKLPPVPPPIKREGGVHIVQEMIDNPPPVRTNLKVTKIETVDQAYDILSSLVTKYEDSLNNERIEFADNEEMYGLLYDAALRSLKDSDKRDEVFAALGHDIAVIDKLDDILDLIFVDETVYSVVIKNLFEELLEITEITEEVFSEILSKEGLNKLKKKGMDVILKTYSDVTKFIETRERLIGKLKNQIMLAGGSDDRQFVIDQLDEIRRHGAGFQVEISTMISLSSKIRRVVERN